MMIAKSFVSAAVFLAVSAGAASAQRAPAEMPPAGYSASQYVDSNGCVFIRAGYNGSTTWVPRYGDDRRPMCGYEPSAGAGVSVQTAQQTAPGSVTVYASAPQPAPAPVAPAATTPARPRVQATLASGAMRIPYSVPPEPIRRPAGAAQAAAPQLGARVYQAQAGGLDTRWSFYDRTGPSPCTNYSPHSQMYAVPSPAAPAQPLRCGPQAQHPADALREQSPRGGVWEPWDGANPYPAPGNNVYMLPPPYAPRWPQPYLQGASHNRPAAAAPRANVSTMGTLPAQETRPSRAVGGQMSNGQYVQVGTYAQSSNARQAIARLQSNGMPVATGRASRGGQDLQVVLAGPFTSQADLNNALSAARRMGYGDAFIR